MDPRIKDIRGLTPDDYYGILSKLWCARTCAPRMRAEWNAEKKALGQCSVTAFLMQDIFGGKVYGVPIGGGHFHCFNVVDGVTFDLTIEQFGANAPDLSDRTEQLREIHFADAEKKARYELLKQKLFEYLPPVLETERLILRRWVEGDAEELFRYASDPDVGPPAGWPPHKNAEESRRIISTVLSIPETYAVVLKETKLPVGSVGLHTGSSTDLTDKDDECELGYWIGKPYWGRGLIPEAGRELLRHAFEDLGMSKVWCGYYDGNIKSKRVQEKLGFRYQWTSEDVDVPQMNEKRKGHVSCITKHEWRKDKMEEQIITVTIKTKGEKCMMSDAEIKEWYEKHIASLFNPEYGRPEITVKLERRDV